MSDLTAPIDMVMARPAMRLPSDDVDVYHTRTDTALATLLYLAAGVLMLTWPALVIAAWRAAL